MEMRRGGTGPSQPESTGPAPAGGWRRRHHQITTKTPPKHYREIRLTPRAGTGLQTAPGRISATPSASVADEQMLLSLRGRS